jgi:hypothetical protein
LTREHLEKLIFDLDLFVLPLTAEHSLKLFGLPAPHSDPLDRILIATALAEDIAIVANDREFKKYKGLPRDLVTVPPASACQIVERLPAWFRISSVWSLLRINSHQRVEFRESHSFRHLLNSVCPVVNAEFRRLNHQGAARHCSATLH